MRTQRERREEPMRLLPVRRMGIVGRTVSYKSAGRRAAHFAHAQGAVLVEVDRAGNGRLLLAIGRDAANVDPAAIVGVFDAGDSDCPKPLAREIEDAIRHHVWSGFRRAA